MIWKLNASTDLDDQFLANPIANTLSVFFGFSLFGACNALGWLRSIGQVLRSICNILLWSSKTHSKGGCSPLNLNTNFHVMVNTWCKLYTRVMWPENPFLFSRNQVNIFCEIHWPRCNPSLWHLPCIYIDSTSWNLDWSPIIPIKTCETYENEIRPPVSINFDDMNRFCRGCNAAVLQDAQYG